MLNNISWTDYLVVVAIIVIIYYLIVAVRYYSGDITEYLSGKRNVNPQPAMQVETTHVESQLHGAPQLDTTAFEAATDEDFEEVEHLIERLRAVIADASTKQADPQELKGYLHLVFQEYPAIKRSTIRSSINELVESECEKHGAVSLSQDEVEMLWNAAG